MASRPKIPLPESWLKYVVSHPWRVIFSALVLTAAFAWQIPHLRFQTSIYDLTIEDLPQTTDYNTFKKTFGCEEIVMVVIGSDNIFAPETFARIDRLAKIFEKMDGIRRVISLPGIKKAMDITSKWDLSAFKNYLAPVSLLERNIISKDGKTTVISLILEDKKLKDPVISAVQEIIDQEKAGRNLYQIGMPVVSAALTQFTQKDFLRLPPITFLLITIVLLILLRNLRGVLITIGAVLMALFWTFGLMAWTGSPLSLLTMIVPIFLIAVGTAYCMYIFPEYSRACKVAETPQEASFNCFTRLGFPTFLAVFTTTIGLGSLLVNKIKEIQFFALFSCFGILSMLVILLLFLPAVMALLPFPPRAESSKSEHKETFLNRLLSKIIALNLNHQKWTLGLIGLISIFGILGILQLQVETNPVDFFRENTDVARNFNDIYQDMSGSFPVNVVLGTKEDDHFEDPKHLRIIAQTQMFLENLEGVDKTVSFADYLKLVNYATNQYEEKFYRLPEESFEVRMLINSFKTMLGLDLLSRFMNENFSSTNIVLRTHIASSREFLEIQKKIEAYLKKNLPPEYSFQITGIGIVISHSSQLITTGQIKSLFMTLVLVFAIMFLLFMSFKVGIIGVLPNCFPIVVSFGMMGWLGMPLSMATSLIAGVAIGLAVDDTIHYLVNYNHEFKKDLNKENALQKTILHTGKPIIFTTLTISLGFSVLMFSSFKPTAVFGLMMVVTMISALIADLMLLPSLMLHVELVTIWDLIRIKLGRDPQEGIPLFKGLSRTQVHYILMSGSLKTYPAGSTIMTEGEISDSMYAIISGRLQVLGNTPQNHKTGRPIKKIITTLETGNVVGEMGMIRSCERSADVVAETPAELLQINEQMIKRLQWLYPPTAHRFFFNLMTILCDRLQNLTECYLENPAILDIQGSYSRDFFMEIVEREIIRSRRYKIDLSLILITLEDPATLPYDKEFVDYNETMAIAVELIRQNVRNTDFVCRLNSLRIAILLPHANLAKASIVSKRILNCVSRTESAKNGFKLKATAEPVYLDPLTRKPVNELLRNALNENNKTTFSTI